MDGRGASVEASSANVGGEVPLNAPSNQKGYPFHSQGRVVLGAEIWGGGGGGLGFRSCRVKDCKGLSS